MKVRVTIGTIFINKQMYRVGDEFEISPERLEKLDKRTVTVLAPPATEPVATASLETQPPSVSEAAVPAPNRRRK